MKKGHVALSLWGVGTLIVGAYTAGVHGLALPQPTVVEVTSSGFNTIIGAKPAAVHVLYASCKCSGRIVDALVTRGAKPGLRETVLVVGDLGAKEAALRGRGFSLRRVSAEELASVYRVNAAPLLLVAGPGGKILYSGGYRRSEAGPIEDEQLINDALLGKSGESRPLFGCAVSAALRRVLDPLGFKS